FVIAGVIRSSSLSTESSARCLLLARGWQDGRSSNFGRRPRSRRQNRMKLMFILPLQDDQAALLRCTECFCRGARIAIAGGEEEAVPPGRESSTGFLPHFLPLEQGYSSRGQK